MGYVCQHCDQPVSGNAVVEGESIVHQRCRDEYVRHQKGYRWDCPECRRSGKVDDPSGATKSVKVKTDDPLCAYNGCMGCHMCGYKMQDFPVRVQCILCDGHGYLKKEPKPVMGVVRYEVEK